ncbi:hypothetical protein HDU84_008577 [Entophlyctis sp. JEL0112]|nr:hypothetical protein HDU84_008577 [Entophlyctis sp. JEL0112]
MTMLHRRSSFSLPAGAAVSSSTSMVFPLRVRHLRLCVLALLAFAAFSFSIFARVRRVERLVSETGIQWFPSNSGVIATSDSRSSSANLLKPRILYYNRHSACHANMVQVTTRLNLTFQTFNPGFLGGLGMKGDRADSIINDGLVRLMCESTDVIIVADTMPDARPLFQSLVRENQLERCKANIVIELTTRFDWGVPDQEEYYKLNWKLAANPPPNLFWVTNNAFEPLDLSYEALATPQFRMLRPTGHSELQAQTVSPADQNLAMCREEEHSAIFAIMRRMDIPFKHVNGGYGGPKTLAKYKAFIEFPYQVSTMKLYENLAAGVVMLFPSKDFFRELIEKDLHAFGPWDKISRAGDNWHLAMDYYNPDIAPYVYYFQIKAMLTSDAELDSKNVRENAPKAYQKLVKKMLHGWADLFGEMGFTGITVDGEKHEPGMGVQVFRAPLYDPESKFPTTEAEYETSADKLDQWRQEKRNERVKAARFARARITDLEMEAYTTSLERKNPQAKKFMIIDPKFANIDLALISLLDFVNGESGKLENEVYGGSLLGKSAEDVARQVKEAVDYAYSFLMSLKPNVAIGPSNYAGAAKVLRSFRIFHTALFDQKHGNADSLAVSLIGSMPSDQQKVLGQKVKTWSKIAYPWAFSNRYSGMDDLIESFTKPRGVVLSFGNGGFVQGLLTILHLRKVLSCNLPVEVFYNGLQDLDSEKLEALARIDGVKTRNLQEVFTGIAEDRNFHRHVLEPSFVVLKEVIYLDDDVILFQNPDEVASKSALFKQYGTLFFKGRSFEFGNSQWVRWFIKSPSVFANSTGRYFKNLSKDEMEASLMLFDKSRLAVVHGLLATCYLNLREVREGGLDKHLTGDKETYWLALELLRIPHKFVPGIAGAAGSLQVKDGEVVKNSVCGPQSHLDEWGELLHVNTRSARYNNELDKWEKSLSHYIAPLSEEPGHIDATVQPWCVSGTDANGKGEVHEVTRAHKDLLLRVRELDMELRHESWKHYLDSHL